MSSYGYNNNNNYKYSYSNNKQKKKFFSETGNKVTGITSIYDYNHNNKPSSNANIYNKNTFPESYGKNSLSKSVMPIYSYEDLNEKYNNEYFDNKINKYNKNDYNNESNSNSNLINRELNSIITSTIGLTNLGNTCFMNTCLQNLIHSEDFIKRLISKKDSINRSTPISYYFFNLCKELAKSTRSVSPNKFKEKFGLKHHLFAGYGQNDTQEFCRVLLEDMNTELNEVKKRNHISN
jgi:ubiquitin C-terminal hydrolase